MEQKRFQRNEIIFRQGEASRCMFQIESGKVGIFLNYGENDQRQLTELKAGQFLGEMGMLDAEPRSATAISLDGETTLLVIDEESFSQFIAKEPEKMHALLQQMSMRLRRISRDCADACRTVSDVVEAEKAGRERDPALKNHIAKTLAGFEASRLEDQKEGGEEA